MIRDINGHWLDTSVFRQPAIQFTNHGYYCDKPEETDEWFEYWFNEREKCINGVEVEGCRITGDQYFYLNFCPILKVGSQANGQKQAVKVEGFPDFWDGDYNYFWVRELAKRGMDKDEFKDLKLFVEIPDYAFKGGYNIIVGKARRKGYSYKTAAIAAKNFFTAPNSLTILGAEDSQHLYPSGLFNMCANYIDFINANTAWTTPSDVVNQPNKGKIKASYIEYIDGVKVEKGFRSQIISLSFKDKPGVARGKDALDVFFEESGKFGVPGLLKKSYAATEDCVKAGSIKTGMITIYGTSGELDSGSVDYADMFSRPEAFDLLPFYNVWDPKVKTQLTGFFHPVNWNMEGYYDENGNSDFEGAKNDELNIRKELLDKGITSSEIQRRLQERPLTPSEAFDTATTNIFPLIEIKNQLAKVKANEWQKKKGIPVNLVYEGKEVVAKPILDGSVTPITSYYNIPDDTRGCVVMYEPVVPNAPKGLYKIGYDPVRQDSGTSLSAIIVYKGVYNNVQNHDIIVAEYVGRTELAEDADRVAEMLAEYYNTTVMHENEVSSVKNYFRRIKKLHLLAMQPDAVISKSINHSKVSRIYGCHMVQQLKDAAERYVQEWLLKIIDYDENNNPIRCLDKIYSQRLLEELSLYNRNGNFDLVSALFMCIFQVQEDELDKEYGAVKENNRIVELKNMISNMYKNTSRSIM